MVTTSKAPSGKGGGARRRPRARTARRADPQVEHLDVDTDRQEGPGRCFSGTRHVARSAADVEQASPRGRCARTARSRRRGSQPAVDEAQVGQAAQGLGLGDALVELLGSVARRAGPRGSRELEQGQSAAKPGPKAPSRPSAPRSGRGGGGSRRGRRHGDQLMLPCSERTASVAARSAGPRPSLSLITSITRRPPGWRMKRAMSARPSPSGARKPSTAGRISRRTKGARPLSRRICRPWLRRSKPMRCVVPGKKTLSASRTRTRPAPFRGGPLPRAPRPRRRRRRWRWTRRWSASGPTAGTSGSRTPGRGGGRPGRGAPPGSRRRGRGRRRRPRSRTR